MSVGKVISCPSQRPVAALRVPVAQVKVGAEVEVDSHWFVCSFSILPSLQIPLMDGVKVVDSHWFVSVLRVPVAQDVEGAEVEVDSHWFVCSFRVPVAQDVEGAEVEVDSH